MLEINDLHASVDGKKILKGLTLSLGEGEVHAIMGPNGSGKSTLSYVLAGRAGYEVTQGSITFRGRNLAELKAEERAAAGIFLAMQYPVEIPGVTTINFLRTALNAHMARMPALTILAPAEATVSRAADGVSVQVHGGPEVRCRLVIAAEGRQSKLREQAGIPVTRLPYGQTGIVCAISHDRPHHNVALEHFLPSGPFAALPMGPSPDAEPGGASNVSAIVWTERTLAAQRILKLDDDRLAREIARRLGDHLGRVRAVGRRWSYPLSAMLVHRYIDTRLALVGDAAHGIHPIAGQGLNLGFQDAIALAGLLIEAQGHGQDPGADALLQRYQRARRPDNLLMLGMTDGLDRLFSNDNPVLRLARDVGIAAVHRTAPLKRFFMRRAMGLDAAGTPSASRQGSGDPA